jgi:hypothetical protein
MSPSVTNVEGVPGPVEEAVRQYLDQLGGLDIGARATLAQMILKLAHSYDEYDGSDLAKLARLNQELRQTLTALMVEVGGDSDDDGQAAHLSTPVWDGPQPRAADARAEGGGGRGPAG